MPYWRSGLLELTRRDRFRDLKLGQLIRRILERREEAPPSILGCLVEEGHHHRVVSLDEGALVAAGTNAHSWKDESETCARRLNSKG